MTAGVRGAALTVLVAVSAAAWLGARHSDSNELGPLLVADSFRPLMSGLEATDRRIELFEAAAARDPYSSIAQTELASLRLQRSRESGDLDDQRQAEEHARRSLELREHRNAEGYRMLAASLLARHSFREAHAVALELVDRWPDEPSHRALLGQIQMELGMYDAAEAIFARLAWDERNLSVSPRLAAWAAIRGETTEAGRLLYLARESARGRTDLPSEQRAWFHLMVGEHEAARGDFEAAEESFAEGLALEPGDFRIVGALVRLEARRGEWARALDYAALLGDAADLRTRAVIGDVHLALCDTAGAEQHYAMVEEAAAESPEPFNRQLYAFRLDHDRRVEETLEILRAEVVERPDVLGYDLLAWALLKSGDPEAAAAASRQALRLGTRDPLFHFHAGMIQQALGRNERAAEHFREALEIDPRFHHRFAAAARSALAGAGR